MATIYLIGSLRNPQVPVVARALRVAGHDVFDDWFAAGPTADDSWKEYEISRGRTFAQAMDGYAARHSFYHDKRHLDRSDVGVLLMPAGKSGHLELGYIIGKGKRGYILLEDSSDRWDCMYRFADGVFTELHDLIIALAEHD
jgi:hypothetical protein